MTNAPPFILILVCILVVFIRYRIPITLAVRLG